MNPTSSEDWFQEGLAAKRARNWTKSLRFSRRAVALDPADQGAWWKAEVVWAERLDPARMKLISVPLPESVLEAGHGR